MGEPMIKRVPMSGPLSGKVAIVTGAGRGIGREEALYLSALGARLVVNDLGTDRDGSGVDAAVAEQLVSEIQGRGGEAIAHVEDISEPAGAESLLRLGIETWGHIDIVVNNAGILRDRMIFKMSIEEWDSVIKVHLRGHFLVTREACIHWRERAAASGQIRGRLINTTSTSGILGNPGQSNYGAAKAGIAALTQIVSLEMARYGVTANAIAPGARTRMTEGVFVETPDQEGAADPVGPEHVARLVGYLASDASDHISGQVFRVRGGTIELYEGWKAVAAIEEAGGWSAVGLAGAMSGLFGTRPSVYTPATVPGQVGTIQPQASG